MRSDISDTGPSGSDRTARAAIRDAALALFAERGPDAVTVREIATAAGVSPALVLHHYGSKDGLRSAVDAHAAAAFDAMLEQLGDGGAAEALRGGGTGSLAEAFAAGFPPGSPLPAYLRRLLLAGDPAGDALVARWLDLTETVLRDLEAAGVARPGGDRRLRAAFLLANDLAVVLLAPQLGRALGGDVLGPEGMRRWVAEATAVYVRGAFVPDPSHPVAEDTGGEP